MSSYPSSGSATLSDSHRRMLFEESDVDPGVAERAGVFSARTGKDVPQESGWLPSRPGMVFPTHTLDGESFPRLRLNTPGKLPKYMQPKGMPNRLYIHPDQHERIRQPGRVRFITEGEKKVLSGVSHGLLMVGLSGVYNGQKDQALIPDWHLLPLDGETYAIAFDSDILQNENVQLAAERQARLLQEAGAKAYVTVLPDAPDGSKQGLDDFLAGGGTIKELRMLTRKYEPGMFGKIRLSRDDKLRGAVEDLERRWWDAEWKGMGGHTERDLALKLIEAATKSGKIHADGLRIKVSWGTLQVGVKVARKTLAKALARLEERGFLYRDNEGRKADKTGAFVLRAKVDQYGEKATKETQELRAFARGGLPLRAPRLRWSRPKFTPKRGTVTGTRRVRESKPLAARDRIERLGKIRGAIVDALEVAGGELTLQELCEVLHRSRPRDVRRRILPILEETGVIEREGDVIKLASDWYAKLDAVREAGGEPEADGLAEERRKRNSRAYHNRDKPLESKPTAVGLKAVQGSREKARDHRRENLIGWVEEKHPPLSLLAVAVRDYLARNPHDAREPAGWIANTLWCYGLFAIEPGTPGREAVRGALGELGGGAYLDGVLKRAKEAA